MPVTIKMFSTTTCAPCKQMKELMKDIDHTQVHLEYLDARAELEQVFKYSIRTVPTFVMTGSDGGFIKQKSGTMSAAEYAEWIG